MGFRVVLTPEDLKRGDLVDPGWHPAKIVEYKEAEAGTDGSTNCMFYFEIVDGPGKGVRPHYRLNEKALSFGKELFATLDFPKNADGCYELSTQLFEQTVGSPLMIYIKRGKSNRGNEFNDVVGFRPV